MGLLSRIRAVEASRAADVQPPRERVVVHEAAGQPHVTREPAPMPVWRQRTLDEASRKGVSPFSASHLVEGPRL